MKKSIKITVTQEDLIKALREMKLVGDSLSISMEVEDLVVDNDDKIILTPVDFYRFEKAIKSHKINLKDLREIILLSYSWWETKRVFPHSTLEDILDYHKVNKIKIKGMAYSEELITATLKALSKCTHPENDLYTRLIKTDPSSSVTFEDYYKKMYITDENS